MIAYSLSLYSSGYDERYKTENILNSLPIKRYYIVIAKYISILLFILAGFLIIFLGNFLLKTAGVSFIKRCPNFNDLIFAFIILGTLNSILIPINYKYCPNSVRVINSILFLVFMIGPNLLVNHLKNNPDSKYANIIFDFLKSGHVFKMLFPTLVTVFIIIVSIGISISIYNNKEFY